MRMRSHLVGLDVLIFGRTLRLLPYFMCANSEGTGETARMRRLAWAFVGRLCDKYHNLMSWLINVCKQTREMIRNMKETEAVLEPSPIEP